MIKLNLIFIMLLTISCSNSITKTHCNCETEKNDSLNYKILSFEKTVAFDTTAVAVEGKLINLNKQKGIDSTCIIFNRDTAYTDAEGSFKFYHIIGGKGKIKIENKCGILANMDHINFGEGCSWVFVVGLKCKD